MFYTFWRRGRKIVKQNDSCNDNPDNNLFLKDDFHIVKYTSDVTQNLRSYRVHSCVVGMCT